MAMFVIRSTAKVLFKKDEEKEGVRELGPLHTNAVNSP
jgi:hypothetical protein